MEIKMDSKENRNKNGQGSDSDSVEKIYRAKNKFNNKIVDTIALIRNASVSYTAICEKCGVSRGWISQVASGTITDPGVQKVERVYDFLLRNQKR
jgi:hypothetical protein